MEGEDVVKGRSAEDKSRSAAAKGGRRMKKGRVGDQKRRGSFWIRKDYEEKRTEPPPFQIKRRGPR